MGYGSTSRNRISSLQENGIWYVSAAKAEHMADALVSIYAGANTPQFKTLIKSIQENLK